MVMKGQYLERPTIIPSGELFLEGLFHRGDRAPAALIVSPLAAGGSPMEVPIVAELAWAMHRAKRATLRFNPRGFGASQGMPGSAADHLSDALAALESLRQSMEDPQAPLAVVGVQGGAEIALELSRRQPQISALALLAPDPALQPRLQGISLPTLVVLPQGSAWPGDRGARGLFRVEEIPETDPQFLRGLPLFGQAITGFLNGVSG